MSKITYLSETIRQNLKALYDLNCPKCKVGMLSKPSTFMKEGINLGGGYCVNCRCVFNTKIDEHNQKMQANQIPHLNVN